MIVSLKSWYAAKGKNVVGCFCPRCVPVICASVAFEDHTEIPDSDFDTMPTEISTTGGDGEHTVDISCRKCGGAYLKYDFTVDVPWEIDEHGDFVRWDFDRLMGNKEIVDAERIKGEDNDQGEA